MKRIVLLTITLLSTSLVTAIPFDPKYNEFVQAYDKEVDNRNIFSIDATADGNQIITYNSKPPFQAKLWNFKTYKVVPIGKIPNEKGKITHLHIKSTGAIFGADDQENEYPLRQ